MRARRRAWSTISTTLRRCRARRAGQAMIGRPRTEWPMTRFSTTAGRSSGARRGVRRASAAPRRAGRRARAAARAGPEPGHDPRAQSDRGGQVGPGEDADADEHADVREDREPGALGPAVLVAAGGVLAAARAASAPGSAGRRPRSTHQSASAAMPIGRAAERASPRAATRNAIQTASASDARRSVCSVDQPAAHLEPSGAAAVAAQPDAGSGRPPRPPAR